MVRKPIKTAILAAAIAIAAPFAMAEGSATFTAENGEILPAPKLAGLTCDRMDQVMTAYAQSLYRGVDTVPAGHPDRPIFDYEDRLAEIFYRQCQRSGLTFQDTAPAFSKGFR